MASEQARCRRAVVVFDHELLGEGIADRLRHHGVATIAVRADDHTRVEEAFATRPCVVVAERATTECLERIAALTPNARIVDISQVIGRGCQDHDQMVDFDTILAACWGAPGL